MNLPILQAIADAEYAETHPDIDSYDMIIVSFSGGKDSMWCLLHLIELGVPLSKIELWHQDVDGFGPNFMDWKCTPGYCRAVAAYFKIPIYFQWKVGGFEGEMLRQDSLTQPTKFDSPDGVVELPAGRGTLSTRRMFPQQSGDLKVRWCSAYLKIDVAARAITSQSRFNDKRTLFVTGERAEESPGRAKYAEFEPHRTDNRDGKKVRRHIDHWRPAHKVKEAQVWELMAKYGINPHPAYRLGWGRVSCAGCIFGNKNQWASLWAVNPEQFIKIATYETEFGKTIRRGQTIFQQAENGQQYPAITYELIIESQDKQWDSHYSIVADEWKIPAGAFGESDGPT